MISRIPYLYFVLVLLIAHPQPPPPVIGDSPNAVHQLYLPQVQVGLEDMYRQCVECESDGT